MKSTGSNMQTYINSKQKGNISMKNFTCEAFIWLNIICSRVSTCTHMIADLDLHTRRVTFIIDDILLDIGHLVVNEINQFRDQGGMHHFFASLITEHYRRAGVEKYTGDICVQPGTFIYPLRV